MCLQAYYDPADDYAKQIKEWAEFRIKEGVIDCPRCGFAMHIDDLKCKYCKTFFPIEDHKAW